MTRKLKEIGWKLKQGEELTPEELTVIYLVVSLSRNADDLNKYFGCEADPEDGRRLVQMVKKVYSGRK